MFYRLTGYVNHPSSFYIDLSICFIIAVLLFILLLIYLSQYIKIDKNNKKEQLEIDKLDYNHKINKLLIDSGIDPNSAWFLSLILKDYFVAIYKANSNGYMYIQAYRCDHIVNEAKGYIEVYISNDSKSITKLVIKPFKGSIIEFHEISLPIVKGEKHD